MGWLGTHDDLRVGRNFSEPGLKVRHAQMKGRPLPVDAVRPRMVLTRVTLGKYNFNAASIEDDTARLSAAAPRGDRAPTQRVAIEGNGAIEVARSDEQVTEAIGWHSESRALTNQANRPRADGAQAPPASGPVERVVRHHHAHLAQT